MSCHCTVAPSGIILTDPSTDSTLLGETALENYSYYPLEPTVYCYLYAETNSQIPRFLRDLRDFFKIVRIVKIRKYQLVLNWLLGEERVHHET
jgi:hypothetical protein